MGAGWQRWWRKPWTLEDAYREALVIIPVGARKKTGSTYIEMQPIIYDPDAFLELGKMMEWMERGYEMMLSRLRQDQHVTYLPKKPERPK